MHTTTTTATLCQCFVDKIILFQFREIPQDGAMCDIVWSDPEEMDEGWLISPRGAGFLFGER